MNCTYTVYVRPSRITRQFICLKKETNRNKNLNGHAEMALLLASVKKILRDTHLCLPAGSKWDSLSIFGRNKSKLNNPPLLVY